MDVCLPVCMYGTNTHRSEDITLDEKAVFWAFLRDESWKESRTVFAP